MTALVDTGVSLYLAPQQSLVSTLFYSDGFSCHGHVQWMHASFKECICYCLWRQQYFSWSLSMQHSYAAETILNSAKTTQRFKSSGTQCHVNWETVTHASKYCCVFIFGKFKQSRIP